MGPDLYLLLGSLGVMLLILIVAVSSRTGQSVQNYFIADESYQAQCYAESWICVEAEGAVTVSGRMLVEHAPSFFFSGGSDSSLSDPG